MADPSDLTQALLLSFVLSLSYQCLSVDMGAKQHLQIQGVSSQERCSLKKEVLSRYLNVPFISASMLLALLTFLAMC